ncbi:hypothetical protein D3C73_1100240 [compost metagenome]
MRHVHAFAVRQFAAVEHGGVDGVGVFGDYAQTQLAVVQQQVHARLKRSDDFRMRQVDPALIARRGIEVQAQGLTSHQLHLALGELADPQFRALQVHQNAERVVELAFDFADPLIALGVIGVFAVAEVQAEDVDPGLHQLANGVDPVGGGTQGGEDFDLFIRRHV